MRMFAQDAGFHRRERVDETDDPEPLRRLKELEAIDRMRERFTLAEALSALGVGRSTYYERKRRLRGEGVKAWFRAAAARRATPGGGGRWRTRSGFSMCVGRCRGRGRRGSRWNWRSGTRSARRARRRWDASCGGR